MHASKRFLPLTETVSPADEAAVAEAIRTANRCATPVYTLGGGTRLRYGARPTRAGIGLATSQLNRVVDYPAADLTITVEAGLTLEELNRRLEKQHQWLPIDVPQADRATVGGLLATDSFGPRSYAHGTVRDYVLGLRAIDGQGEAFGCGTKVVKNAAGYNIPRLLVGSLGTLGVITQATLMVRPLPEATALASCDVTDFEMAEHLLARLARTQTLPVAIELLAGHWRFFNRTMPPMGDGAAARLVVGLDGNQTEVAWMLQRLAEEWRSGGAGEITTVLDSEAEAWWGALVGFPSEVQINVLPSGTTRMVETLLELAPHSAVQAHAGNGVILANFSRAWAGRLGLPQSLGSLPPSLGSEANATGDESPARKIIADPFLCLLRDKVRPAVAAAGGKLTVVAAPDAGLLTLEDIWGRDLNGGTIAQEIKNRFDPRNILNPGRFVFGE